MLKLLCPELFGEELEELAALSPDIYQLKFEKESVDYPIWLGADGKSESERAKPRLLGKSPGYDSSAGFHAAPMPPIAT